MLNFHFWEPVYYAPADVLKYDSKPGFPSETCEAKWRFVGFGESVRDILTYKILADDTNKIIFRSYVRTALTDTECNARLNPTGGETTPIVEVIKSP